MTNALCRYESHRGHEWRSSETDRLICGICHPPANPRLVVGIVTGGQEVPVVRGADVIPLRPPPPPPEDPPDEPVTLL